MLIDIFREKCEISDLIEPYNSIAQKIGLEDTKKLFVLQGRWIFINSKETTENSPQKEIESLIGKEVFLILQKYYEGNYIYFTKLDNMINKIRDELIAKDFNGMNYGALACKYNLSEMWIRKIIEKNKHNNDKQVTFSDLI